MPTYICRIPKTCYTCSDKLNEQLKNVKTRASSFAGRELSINFQKDLSIPFGTIQ